MAESESGTNVGKVPTWALVLGTGIGVVFYAQREFVPRSETNLTAARRDDQMQVLERKDEELTRSMKDFAATVEKSNADMRASIETQAKEMRAVIEAHAKLPAHGGTADQLTALHAYLYTMSTANNNYQRTAYTILQQLAAKDKIVVPPMPETPSFPPPGAISAPSR